MAANFLSAVGYSLVVNDLRREQARGLESQGAGFRTRPERSPSPVRWCFRCCLTMKRFSGGTGWWRFARVTSGAPVCAHFQEHRQEDDCRGKCGAAGKRVDCSRNLAGVSKKQQQRERYRFGFRDRKNCSINISLSFSHWQNLRFVNSATPSWRKNAMAMFAAIQHLGLAEIFSWLKKRGVTENTFNTVLQNSQQSSELSTVSARLL